MNKLDLEYSDEVMVNWYQFDDVDKMKLDDIEKHFHDLWYPDVDDIDIIHPNFLWIVSIDHSGDIKFFLNY